MTAVRPLIIAIGLEPQIEKSIADLLADTEVVSLQMSIDVLLAAPATHPCLVISGLPKGGLCPNELAQTLRMQYPEASLFLCCISKSGFERKTFIKHGFTDAFLIPMDTITLRVAISEILAKVSEGHIQVYRPVKIIDVEKGSILDFDTSIFFPANNKYIKLSHAGDSLDEERIEKMKKSKFNSIYIPAEQMQKFYNYTAKRLQDLSTGTTSLTERRERLSKAVRDLIGALFTEHSASFETGQIILKDCAEIVKSYILQGADSEWFQRIQQVVGERGDNYSHASNVSTLAALFSMGLGIGKPHDLALAGLLHDIGVAELPAEVQSLETEMMDAEQLAAYHKHPEMSVNLIKSRKIIVPEVVMKAILQHHELYNGTGYPNGLFGDRICKEAQILSIANTFENLTSLKPGKALMTPAEAVEKLRQLQVNDPARIHYNPELLKKLLTLFPV
ncbi:MAG: HD domain-containing protein [Bdellovibrionales bacterium]|nr:HD domain-containing protein [Oligoflexia bacterium]